VVGAGGVVEVRGDATLAGGWASVTKMVTALGVLVAVEEETIDLDEPAGPPGSTVRHVLAHASGMAFAGDLVLDRPGRRRIYSNHGFELLGGLVADRAGIPFSSYLTEGVLAPLGMAATRLEGSAAAGLVGPLDDLVRLASELLAPTLISPTTFASATTVAFPGLGGVLPGFGRQSPLDWGLGFEIRDGKSPHWTGTRNSPATFGHFGRTGSFLWVDPEAGLALSVLTGEDFAPWCRDAWPALSDAVLHTYAGRRRPEAPAACLLLPTSSPAPAPASRTRRCTPRNSGSRSRAWSSSRSCSSRRSWRLLLY
jgi:CubicO group peptidase (beta-lactamase class C family)